MPSKAIYQTSPRGCCGVYLKMVYSFRNSPTRFSINCVFRYESLVLFAPGDNRRDLGLAAAGLKKDVQNILLHGFGA